MGLLFSVSLSVGCGGGDDEEDYRYERADIETAVFGTWRGSWEPVDGSESTAFELEIRASDGDLGSMCGNRTLGGLRPQCVATSSIAVSGTVSLRDGSEPVELDGGITVPGLTLSEVWVSLTRDGAPFGVVADWTEAEGWSFCRADDGNGGIIAGCTLTERVP